MFWACLEVPKECFNSARDLREPISEGVGEHYPEKNSKIDRKNAKLALEFSGALQRPSVQRTSQGHQSTMATSKFKYVEMNGPSHAVQNERSTARRTAAASLMHSASNLRARATTGTGAGGRLSLASDADQRVTWRAQLDAVRRQQQPSR